MLILSRKRGESITIGDGVTVTVMSVQGDRVKIGILAPDEVPVHRQEIYERIEGRVACLSPCRMCVELQPQLAVN